MYHAMLSVIKISYCKLFRKTHHLLFSFSLTPGYGVFGNAIGVILSTVPASETLLNQVGIQYKRTRWSPVSNGINLPVKTQLITISTYLVTSSVDATSQRNAAIGEKVEFKWNIKLKHLKH